MRPPGASEDPPRAPAAAARRRRTPSAVELALLVAGLALVPAYAWLLDDAYVYFRYADNALFLGRGLVYNAGEWVEGYSEPLWMLVLLPLRALRLPYWAIVRGLGLLAFAGFWWQVVRLNRRTSPADAPVVNAPLALFATNYAVLSYFTSGLGTPLVQLLAPAFALFALRPGSLPLQLAVAVAPLARQELVLATGVAVLWSWLRERRFPLRLAALSAGFGGAWLVARVWAYADVVPNTYHLKGLPMPRQGLAYLHDALVPYGLYVALPAGVALYALARRRAPALALHGRERLAMLAMACPVLAYAVWIGGDARHFRYLAFPLELAVLAGAGLVEHALVALGAGRRVRRAAAPAALAVAVVVAALHPRQLGGHPLTDPSTRAVDGIKDAHAYRSLRQVTPSPWAWRGPEPAWERYAELRDAPPPAETVADPTCVRPFLRPDVRVINDWGLTDPVLARVDVPTDRPGHKTQLRPLGADLAELQTAYGRPPERGMYRAMVERGEAPLWVEASLEVLEAVERRAYNDHDVLENLRLALRPTGRIDPVLDPLSPEAEAVLRALRGRPDGLTSAQLGRLLAARGIDADPRALWERVRFELVPHGVRTRGARMVLVHRGPE